MFEIGDRVYVEDTYDLIPEVRGQFGTVRGTRGSYYSIELDNGAKPAVVFNINALPFFTFDPQYLTIVNEEISWEV